MDLAQDRSNKVRWLLLIATLTVAIRAAYFFILVPYNPEATDRDLYLQIARNVIAHSGFSMGIDPNDTVITTIRGPVPVYFLVAILWLFGDHTLSIAISNWIVDAGTCVLLYLTTLEVFDKKQIALTVSLLFALYAPEIFYSWQALSEPLFTLFLVAFMLSFLRALQIPSIGRFVAAGILLGLATYSRPVMQYYFLVAIVTLIWLLRARGKEIVKWGVALALSFVVVMTPWTLRNYLIFGQIIPVSSYFGTNLYATHYTLGESDYLRPREFLSEASTSLDELLEARLGPVYKELPQPQADQIAEEEAFKIIRQYPDRYLILSIVRFFRLWYYIFGVTVHHTSPPLVMYLVLLLHGSLWVLSIIAFIYYRNSWVQRSIPLFLMLFYYTVVHSAIHVQVRYVIPIVPYVMSFASVTIVQFLPHFKHILSLRLAHE